MIKESVLSKPQYETTHEKNLEIAMRDGTILRANITRPNVEGKFPVLIERTPYNKEAGSENGVGSPQFFAQRGMLSLFRMCAAGLPLTVISIHFGTMVRGSIVMAMIPLSGRRCNRGLMAM